MATQKLTEALDYSLYIHFLPYPSSSDILILVSDELFRSCRLFTQMIPDYKMMRKLKQIHILSEDLAVLEADDF
jgi:hypothetical protein